MVETKFNPGGPVTMYESAESSISPLMMIPRNTQEIEEMIKKNFNPGGLVAMYESA